MCLAQELCTSTGQTRLSDFAVVRMRLPRDKAALLEPYDDLVHRLRGDKAFFGEVCVRQAGILLEHGQGGVLWRGHTKIPETSVHLKFEGLLHPFNQIAEPFVGRRGHP